VTSEQIEIVERMRAEGKSFGQIAKRIGMSKGAVSWYCLRHGIESPRPRQSREAYSYSDYGRGGHTVRRFTSRDDARLLDMRKRGISVSEIARTLGRNTSSINGRLMTLAARDEAKA
jgi:DNA-binding CsgD family transcriptional regulator